MRMCIYIERESQRERVWSGLVLWLINHCKLLMPNLFLYI